VAGFDCIANMAAEAHAATTSTCGDDVRGGCRNYGIGSANRLADSHAGPAREGRTEFVVTGGEHAMRRGFTLLELLVVIAIIVVLFALLPGQGEIPVTLAFGWVTYLWRVVPKLHPDPWTVCTAVLCLAGVIVGSHCFLRWAVGSESRWPWNRTLRGVGLIVLMFVAGIAVVGMIHQTSWLVRSPEPLTTRSSFGRTMSANNLKQIAIAAEGYQIAMDSHELPRSSFNAAGQPMHAWQTMLLPYIEQNSIYMQIDFTKPWTHPANAEPLGRYVRTYANPAIFEDKVNGFGASHYAGNVHVVLGDAKTFDSFPAGASQTIFAGEVSSNFRAWGDPLNVRDPRYGVNGHPQGFGAPNRRPTQFAMLDGSVRTFDPKEIAELMNKVPE
jgi:prepilin-type N-terminal cleavage/methylation domain-containing protein